MSKKPFASGDTSKVYDNNDGTITKVIKGEVTEVVLPGINTPTMKYVATCISAKGNTIVKEKISCEPFILKNLKDLVNHWDESLINTHELFDYIEQYLRNGIKPFLDYRAPKAFIDYLYTIGDKGESIRQVYLFIQLCQLTQELKDRDIYNIDWNHENFGYKKGHLALVELGGAKKKKSKERI